MKIILNNISVNLNDTIIAVSSHAKNLGQLQTIFSHFLRDCFFEMTSKPSFEKNSTWYVNEIISFIPNNEHLLRFFV